MGGYFAQTIWPVIFYGQCHKEDAGGTSLLPPPHLAPYPTRLQASPGDRGSAGELLRKCNGFFPIIALEGDNGDLSDNECGSVATKSKCVGFCRDWLVFSDDVALQ
jgi:hypothetical protein